MHELYELKEMLCKELREYGSKGELTAGALDTIDKLAHAAKNVAKLIEADDGYSERPYDRSYRRSYRRDAMGRYSGRYSRDEGFTEDLRELIKDAPNEAVRAKLQKLIETME